MIRIINLFILLIKRFVSNPISSIRLVNLINLKTLLYAAGNEDHRILLSNLDKKLLEREHTLIKTLHFEDTGDTVQVQITDARTFSDFKIIVYGIVTCQSRIKQIQLYNGDLLLSSYNFSHTGSDFEASKRFFFEEDTDPNLIFKVHSLVFINESNTKCKLDFNTYESYEYNKLSWNTQYRILKQKNLHALSFKNIEKKIAAFPTQPTFSIIVPTYNSDPEFLNICVRSVIRQSYDKWELVLYDDFSSRDDTLELIKEWAFKEPRVKAVFGNENLNVSLATNNGIKNASGEYICFLDHDDYLNTNALFHVAQAINENPNVKLIYSDEDIVEENDNTDSVMLKPGFSMDLLRVQNYINHLCVVKKEVGDQVGWLDGDFYGAQDYDLLFRIIENIDSKDIIHIPKVLYHWRKNPGSIIENPSSKPFVFENGLRALQSHLDRCGIETTVDHGLKIGNYSVNYQVKSQLKVSIIIHYDGHSYLKQCINSINDKTSYANLEIIIVNNATTTNDHNDYLDELDKQENFTVIHRINKCSIPNNYNHAAMIASGDVLLFLDANLELITKNWLEKLIASSSLKEIGVMGSLILYPDDTILHDGMTFSLSPKDPTIPIFTNINQYKEIYTTQRFIPYSIKNVSAVAPEFIFITKSLFDEVSGFESQFLADMYYNIDLCLKVSKYGKRIVQNPHIQSHIHIPKDNATSPSEALIRYKEVKFLYNKWESILSKPDPFFNSSIQIKDQKMNLIH